MPTLLLLTALGLQATARISGLVTDATLLPLPGATVEVDGRVVATSGDDGTFEICARAPPSRLRVALDGFDPYETLLQPVATDLRITLGVRRFEDRVRVTA